MDHGECVKTVAIRQRQVQEHDVSDTLRQLLQSKRQAVSVGELHRRVPDTGLAQHLPDQPRVTRVVLDQQRTDRCLRTTHVMSGSVTIVNQKSSIDFTTVMNCSRSTGLVI